jgi:hypothetical protein
MKDEMCLQCGGEIGLDCRCNLTEEEEESGAWD